jgi:PBP1b-binding outer membrane lipoprotein LpoB
MIKNISVVILLALLVSGCSTRQDPIVYSAEPIDRPNLILPRTTPLDMRSSQIYVITQDNIEHMFADLENSGHPVVLFAFNEQGYEALSLNMADLLRLIEEQGAVIAAYEEYYVQTISVIDEHNNTLTE